MLERIEAAFARPRAPLYLGAFAVALCLPALGLGLQNDDYGLAIRVARGAPAWDLFDFRTDGHALRARGLSSWWTDPNGSLRFFRPVSSLLHTLEFTLWPNAPWLMLLTNALVYGGCVALAAALYRRISPSGAGVAALLFAIDQAHATSIGWISGRNTLLASLFSLAALLFHVRRRAPERGASWTSTVAVVLALLSGEAGVWSLALLLAYALVLQPGTAFRDRTTSGLSVYGVVPGRCAATPPGPTVRKPGAGLRTVALAMEPGSMNARLRGLAPQLAVATVWAAAYLAFGFGLRGSSSYYRDLSSPVHALLQGVLDLPVWAASRFGVGVVSLALFLPETWARLAALPLAVLLLWLVLPALRASQPARMYALAALFCLAPLLFTLPNARVLIGPNFGLLGCIGIAVAEGTTLATTRWRSRTLWRLHLALGALFPLALRSVALIEHGTRALVAAIDPPTRDVVLLRSPTELLSSFATLALEHGGHAGPHTLHQLYVGGSELWIERTAPAAIELVAARGWGFAPGERLFAAPDALPRAGDELRLQDMTVRVLDSTTDGRPQRVRFTFSTPLASADGRWLVWQEGGPEPWTPPPVGGRVHLEALPFQRALPPDWSVW